MNKKPRKQREMQNPLTGDMAPPPERQYYSLGFVCGMIKQPPDFVLHLMRQAGVSFAWTQDGIGVIRGDDLQRIAALVRDAKDEVEGQVAAAPFN